MSSNNLPAGKYKRAPDCTFREIGGEIFVVSPTTGGVHLLNDVGSFIWSLLDGENSAEDIMRSLCEEYDVTEEEALCDLAAFLNELTQAQLVCLCD